MKKTIRVFIIIVVTMMFGIMINNESQANSNDLYLNELSFKVLIEEDGDLTVEEEWNINIKNTNTLFKTFETDSSKYGKITDVTVTDITYGSKQLKEIDTLMHHVTKDCYYGLTNDDGDFEIAWGIGMDNSLGNRTYLIRYTVKDVIKQYSDYSELYWQFVGKDFAVDAKKIKGEIYTEVESSTTQDIKVWGHTEDLNGTVYPTSDNVIIFELNNFKNGKFVEIRTLIPNNLVGNVTRKESGEILPIVLKEEEKWANDANFRRTIGNIIPIIITIITLIGGIATIIWLIIKIIKTLKKIVSSKPLKPSQEITYYRELPQNNVTPLEALYIYGERKRKIDGSELGKVFSATIMDLVLKGKLTFIVDSTGKKDGTKIGIPDKTNLLKDLSSDERNFAKIVLEATREYKKDEITLKELQKYIKRIPAEDLQNMPETLHIKMIDKLSKRGIIDKNNFKNYKKVNSKLGLYIVIAILVILFQFSFTLLPNSIINIIRIIIIVLTIANTILTKQEMKRIAVYTQAGVDESTKWKGLKKYMREFSLLKEKEVPDIVIWEKFLVYATVFGISDKVLKQLKIVYPNIEEMTSAGNYTYMNVMISTNFARSFSSAISTSMSSAYSSASGSGGGFSGGGGGGRWPEEAEEEDKPPYKILVHS